MSLEELIQRQQHSKIIPRKIPLSQEVKRSILLLIFTLMGIIIMLSVVFLLNTSQSTQKGYILKKEQIDKEEFLLMNRELINKIIEAQSFKTIQGNSAVQKMEKPENQVYVKEKK